MCHLFDLHTHHTYIHSSYTYAHHTHTLLYLVLPTLCSNGGVERNHQNHEHETSKDGVAHREVEEEEGEHYLEWGRPDHVEVGHEVHEPLCVDRHEVDYLSHCLLAACPVAQMEGLKRGMCSLFDEPVKIERGQIMGH